jgi:hypothetical protein
LFLLTHSRSINPTPTPSQSPPLAPDQPHSIHPRTLPEPRHSRKSPLLSSRNSCPSSIPSLNAFSVIASLLVSPRSPVGVLHASSRSSSHLFLLLFIIFLFFFGQFTLISTSQDHTSSPKKPQQQRAGVKRAQHGGWPVFSDQRIDYFFRSSARAVLFCTSS